MNKPALLQYSIVDVEEGETKVILTAAANTGNCGCVR